MPQLESSQKALGCSISRALLIMLTQVDHVRDAFLCLLWQFVCRQHLPAPEEHARLEGTQEVDQVVWLAGARCQGAYCLQRSHDQRHDCRNHIHVCTYVRTRS